MRAADTISERTPLRRLLLSDGHDRGAPWLVDELRARGVAIEHVTADELLGARRLEHRVGADGVQLEIELADDRTISSEELGVVVNRLVGVPLEDLPVREHDREYARAELYALWLSCLEGLPCPVLNPPTVTALSGIWLGTAEWALRAGRAGLPVAPVMLCGAPDGAPDPPSLVVLVACDAVFGPPAAAALADRCLGLARDVGADLLELRFDADPDGEPWLVGASTLADLRRGGAALADHLARELP